MPMVYSASMHRQERFSPITKPTTLNVRSKRVKRVIELFTTTWKSQHEIAAEVGFKTHVTVHDIVERYELKRPVRSVGMRMVGGNG